jgi:hypothetical protein
VAFSFDEEVGVLEIFLSMNDWIKALIIGGFFTTIITCFLGAFYFLHRQKMKVFEIREKLELMEKRELANRIEMSRDGLQLPGLNEINKHDQQRLQYLLDTYIRTDKDDE